MEEIKFISIGNSLDNVVKSQFFGKSCFKYNDKPFIAFFENCMVFKLNGDDHTQALALGGAVLFDPSGKKRPMKEWVQLGFEHQEEWSIYAKAALEYIKLIINK